MSEWTEGVCSDGAAILRDGQPVPISELLDHLNRCEFIRSAALEEAAKVADELTHVPIEWPISGNTRPHEPTQKAIAIAIRSLKDKT